MSRVAIIGCGVVGAAIAYELSRVQGLEVTLLDANRPASGSTGAALGVLMGAISKKTKGRAWRLREASLRRYYSLIPELEKITGQQIAYNRQGILLLRFVGEDIAKWEKLAQTRYSQGFALEIWDREQLQRQCPQVNHESIVGAIYSPQDMQIHPTQLTLSLVEAAAIGGVKCLFGVTVEAMAARDSQTENVRYCHELVTSVGILSFDWIIIAAGNGSTLFVQPSLQIRPVLGQALHLRLGKELGSTAFQPVITGHDVHIVPLGEGEYWVGATVEFPTETGEVIADSSLLEQVRTEAIAFCPELANATLLHSWQGKRPRPEGQSAPVIERLSGYNNVLLATGHYRNGVLLAPATALAIRDLLVRE